MDRFVCSCGKIVDGDFMHLSCFRREQFSRSKNKEIVEKIVNRFLEWRLPDDFCPDAGIKFTKPDKLYPLINNADYYHWPIGTILAAEVHRLNRGRPEGRRCVSCGGAGVILTDGHRPDRECGKCDGTGVVR